MPPLRPFPFPNLTIGTDIAQISRIRSIIASKTPQDRRLARFIRHLLTKREQQPFYQRFENTFRRDTGVLDENDVAGGEIDKIATHLAGRWAAKEAVVKACSWRRLTFDKIQILKSPTSQRIYGVVLDQAASTQAPVPAESGLDGASEEERGQVVKVSISHDGDYATAVCLAAEEGREGDVGGEAAAREP